MDLFKEEHFSSSHIGHLGLVAAKIDDLNLIDLIDNRLPISEAHGAKVSHGERVAAMIMNGLGFIDSRLYLFPEFLNDKPLDRLFNRHVEAEWFNDDASGRCLDAIAAYGTTKLFTELSITIGQARGLLGNSTHIDTTTLSLFGDYEHLVKDDTFQVDSVFLKTPERIDALMMVMTLCLMVYGVSEYELHQSLQEKNETILSQIKKPTNTPSLRWVYFLFRVVNELTVTTGGHVQKLVVNLNGILRKIIRHFGKRASAIYLNPAGAVT